MEAVVTIAKGDTLTLVVEGIAQGGDAIAHAPDGRIVFVDRGLPSETVQARVTRAKKRVIFAQRLNAPKVDGCDHAHRCGGCRFWGASYDDEIRLKMDATLDALGRISKLPWPEPTRTPDVAATGYRTRVRFRVSPDQGIALLGQGSHALVPIDHCAVLDPALTEAVSAFPALIRRYGPQRVFAEVDDEGEVFVVLEVETLPVAPLGALPKGIAGLAARRGRRRQALGGAAEMVRHYGTARVREPSGGFSQGNARLNRRLVDQVVALATAGDAAPRVLELFSGAGNLTFPLLDAGATVDAIDVAGPAIAAARSTWEGGGWPQARFVIGDLHKAPLPVDGDYDVVVTDPPRGGMKPWLLEAITQTEATRVVYVSCDPPALARDAARLHEGGGWQVTHLELLDMFPRTAHVEAIAVFERPPRGA